MQKKSENSFSAFKFIFIMMSIGLLLLWMEESGRSIYSRLYGEMHGTSIPWFSLLLNLGFVLFTSGLLWILKNGKSKIILAIMLLLLSLKIISTFSWFNQLRVFENNSILYYIFISNSPFTWPIRPLLWNESSKIFYYNNIVLIFWIDTSISFFVYMFALIKQPNALNRSKKISIFEQGDKSRIPNWVWLTAGCISLLVCIEETIGWEIKKNQFLQSIGNEQLASSFADHDMPYRNVIEYGTIIVCLAITSVCIYKFRRSKLRKNVTN